ncbi:ParA family protein [Kiritimatiellaeota bacterium B1221]|nr:ParA family protein [Kiritimatiellaeota bacterium B1221]
MSIIALYSSKGGVGKTASAVNLSYYAARAGNRTLLIDLDQQGASGYYFRIRSSGKSDARAVMKGKSGALEAIRETDYPGLHLLPAHRAYRNFDAVLDGMKRSKSRLADFVSEVSGDYDQVVLDCPPTLSHVAENIFKAADVVLIPVIPTTLSLRTYEQLKVFFDQKDYKKKKLRPFFSMVEKRKRLHQDSVETLRASEKRLLKTMIPYCAQVEAMGVHREPVLAYAPRHAASMAFRNLWKEVTEE